MKVMTIVRYFWHGFIHRGTTFMYLQYNRAPLFITFCQMFGRRRTPSARPSCLMFWIERPIARISPSLVLYRVPRSGSFTLAKRSQSHGLISSEYGGCSRISHFQRRKRTVTGSAVWPLTLSWRRMGFCTTKCRPFLLSPCDYNLVAKVKESLRGTQNNSRDQLIHTIGRSIGKSTNMDMLMVYNTFQTFGKMW